MNISIVIPLYNEEESLPELITLQVALQTEPGISPLLGSTIDGLMYVMGIASIVIPGMLLLSWRK